MATSSIRSHSTPSSPQDQYLAASISNSGQKRHRLHLPAAGSGSSNRRDSSTIHSFLSKQTAVGLIIIALLQSSFHDAHAGDERPWWYDYQTVLSHPWQKRDQAWEMGIMAERSVWATGWYGPWWIQHQMRLTNRWSVRDRTAPFRKLGIRNVFYYDAGEFGQFVALVRDRKIVLNQWELCFYRDEPGKLMWFGKNGFYQDAHPLDLKNYRDFNLPAWKRPDGSRVSNVFELARVSFDGKRDPWDHSNVRPSRAIAEKLNLDAFLHSGPDPVPAKAGLSLGRICSYDHSNPFLLKDFEAGVGMMLTLQPDVLHFDNYFDNELLYPDHSAFGPWSLENFRQFLIAHRDTLQQQQIDVGDLNDLDLKKYITDKPFRSRGLRWHHHNKAWCDDPIWNMFVCSKYQDANQLFRDLYAFCKSRSRQEGTEVVVVGNANPLFPGRSMTHGALDIAHFEHHATGQFGPIVVPTGLPPLGRLGGVVRLGAAVSSAGYCWPTVYVPQHLSGKGHENLHQVIAMDCLANRGVLDYNYQYRNGYSPGSDSSAAWADCFIKQFASYYGRRLPRADVGLVFPGQTQLANLSVFALVPELSLYDYLGWAQAMTELHVQWEAIPDDQISDQRLANFKAVVLPTVTCLSDTAITQITKYVQHGGQIIVSGNVGTRYGLDQFLWHRPPNKTLMTNLSKLVRSSSTVDTAHTHQPIVCDDSPGKQFYTDIADGIRKKGKPTIRNALDQCLPVADRAVQTNTDRLIGLFAYFESNRHVAVDLVNYNVDAATDKVTPARNITVTIQPPDGTRFSTDTVTLISPDHRTPTSQKESTKPLTPWQYPPIKLAATRRSDGTLHVSVPPLRVYCRISAHVENR